MSTYDVTVTGPSPRMAMLAALIRKILPVRPVPSRDDRRLFTKAARDAIRAEAARRHLDAA